MALQLARDNQARITAADKRAQLLSAACDSFTAKWKKAMARVLRADVKQRPPALSIDRHLLGAVGAEPIAEEARLMHNGYRPGLAIRLGLGYQLMNAAGVAGRRQS